MGKKDKLEEWVKALYMSDVSQKEISAKTGISEQSISKWATTGGWEAIRKARLVTKDVELKNAYEQLSELNAAIKKRPEGQRYPDPKEADVQRKLSKTIKDLESSTPIWQIVQVSTELVRYVRVIDPKKAIEMSELIDSFIKQKSSTT